MLQQSTVNFLKQLAKNNNKPWFDEHRKEYEAAKADFELLVTAVLAKLVTVEPSFRDLKAKDCIFRIFRDVRFSKDKTPYKAHFSAAFSSTGKKGMGGGYYLHLEPGKIFVGGGMWMPDNEALKKIRQEIDYNFDAFKKILNNAGFKKLFGKPDESDKLKKMPQGYTEDNAAAEYLKLKSFTVGHKMSAADPTEKNFVKECVTAFAAMKPFIAFLNAAVD